MSVYYSYYINWTKKDNELVFRVDNEEGFLREVTSEFGPMMFDTQELAQKDFYARLYEDENIRFGKYFDTNGGAKVKKKSDQKKVALPKVSEERERITNMVVLPTYKDLERNKVYNEDCMTTMSRMPDGFVDHVITSPPYNAGITYNNEGDETRMYDLYDDNLDDYQYEEWLFKVIDELLRVTKGHIFFNIQMLGRNKRTVMKLMGKYNEKIKDMIIWNKKVAPPHIQPGVMNSKFEFIIVLSNQKPESKKFLDGNFKGNFNNVLEGGNATGNKYSKLNKATFPLYLPRTILNRFGKKGELIYDPFNGTGTTGDACVIESRDFIGSEIDPKQCEISNQRIKDQSAKLLIQFDEY